MLNTKETFFESCTRHFSFLTKNFGFSQKTEAFSLQGIVQFSSETLVIKCFLEWAEPGEQYFCVSLYPQVEYPYGNSFTKQPADNFKSFGYRLSLLLRFREPGLNCYSTEAGQRLTVEDVDRTIANFAEGLKEYGQDILQGDFSVFPELERLMKEEFQKKKQEEPKKAWSLWNLFRH